MISADAVKSAISAVRYPEIDRPLVDLGLVQNVRVDGERVVLDVDLTTPASPHKGAIDRALREAALGVPGVAELEIRWNPLVRGRDVPPEDPIPGVKNVVLVLSGKGGVGKSSVAVNLSLALARSGASVGLLDADIYGPSIPTMMGIQGRPRATEHKKIEPLLRSGVKLMSIGFLLEDDRTAVIWRGPMLHGALLQFVGDVAWGKLDYLVMDLPPGTGDVALTISQRVRTTGAVIVTTPQEVAIADVYKAVAMCQKVAIPVLGVVENFSTFICPNCRHESQLFGSGGGDKIAEFSQSRIIGRIPLDPLVREWGDKGTPVVEAAPDSDVAQAFVRTAEALAAQITLEHYARTGTLEPVKQKARLPIVR
jgi:ATP-binding protein involved in chromosome partitioning